MIGSYWTDERVAGGVLASGLLSSEMGWATIGWSTSWLISALLGSGVPALPFLMPAAIGVALLVR